MMFFGLSRQQVFKIIFLVAIISSFAGPFLGTGIFSMYRILIVILLLFYPDYFVKELLSRNIVDWLFIAFAYFAMLSLFWAPHIGRAINYSIALYFDLIFVVFIGFYMHYIKDYKQLAIMMHCVLISLLAIAFYEVVTNDHFSISDDQTDIFPAKAPMAFYGNPNNLVSLIAIIFPLVFSTSNLIFRNSKYLDNLYIFILTISTIVICIFSYSTAAILVILMTLFLFFLLSPKKIRKLLFAIPIMILIYFSITNFAVKRFSLVDFVEQGYRKVELSEASGPIRLKFLKICNMQFVDSYGFGGGSWAIDANMNKYSGKAEIDVAGINSPHNFFGELAANYGFFIFLFLTIIVRKLFWYLNNIIYNQDIGWEKYILKGAFITLLIFPFITSLPSSAFQQRPYWIILGILLHYSLVKESQTAKYEQL